jgi:hypothetical protein
MSDGPPPKRKDSTARGKRAKLADSQPLGFYCGGCSTWTGKLGPPREIQRPDGKKVIGGDVVCATCNVVITGFMLKSATPRA